MPAWTILRRDPSRKSSADLAVANKTTAASSTDQREHAKQLGMPRLSFMKSLFGRTKSQEKGRGDRHNNADVVDGKVALGSVPPAIKSVSRLLLSIVVQQRRGARVECRHSKSVGARKRTTSSSYSEVGEDAPRVDSVSASAVESRASKVHARRAPGGRPV